MTCGIMPSGPLLWHATCHVMKRKLKKALACADTLVTLKEYPNQSDGDAPPVRKCRWALDVDSCRLRDERSDSGHPPFATAATAAGPAATQPSPDVGCRLPAGV